MVVPGADHDGLYLRETIIAYLERNSTPHHDYGCYSEESVDYMLLVLKVAYDMIEGGAEKGTLCCGTGIGVSITANKIKGIRAAMYTNEFCVEATRRHSDANILCMGGRVVDKEIAVRPTKIFLEIPFDGGRHIRRIVQIKEIKDGEKLQRNKQIGHQVFEMAHPLIQHELAFLGDKSIGSKELRSLVGKVVVLTYYEATRDLPLEETQVEMPVATVTTKMLSSRRLAFVPILRADLNMVDTVPELVPAVKVDYIGLYRNHETLQSVEYCSKLPQDTNERDVIVLNPVLATSGSAVGAVNIIKCSRPKSIKFMCVIAVPEGVKALSKAHLDMLIYCTHIDGHLNESGYIVPGLDDVDDRIFGTL